MRKNILGMALAMMASGGSAAIWVPFGSTSSGKFYLDMAATPTVGPIKDEWVKYELKQPDNDHSVMLKVLWRINCAANSLAVKAETKYAVDGNVTRHFVKDDNELEFGPATPDSIAEFQVKAACK